MKKYLHPKNLPLAVTLLGLLGFVLRLWTLGSGPDAEGLYASAPLAWTLLWVVTALVPVTVFMMSSPLTEPVKYAKNFPASPVSAIGALLGALGITLTALGMFSGADSWKFLTAVIGVAAGVMMVLLAFARLKGETPNFLYHVAVCLFLALRIFFQCKQWSNQPQISVFLFPFLAQICAMLAVYQLCAFDVDMGSRRASLFWSLLAVYLCLVALPSEKEIVFYGGVAVWLLTNLCSLKIVKKRKPVVAEPTEPVQAQLENSDVSMEELKSWLDGD